MVAVGRRGQVAGAPLVMGVCLGLALLLALPTSPAQAAPPWNTRDELICRGNSGVGFSYYWGGSCWCASGCSRNTACPAGSCSGSCPSCTHYGTYGADCSGFVNKVWQVPNPIAVTTCGHGPYVANSYRSSTAYWNVIPRGSVLAGDVLASSTHVVLFHYGNPWGSMVVYEARGCSYGIVHNSRTCSSAYSAAKRINISSGCACSPGATQNQACGNCGTRTRTCLSSCQWGAWGTCTGQGVCSPGSTQSEGCGNCGTRSRTCTSSCTWGTWSTCAGQGVCAAGTVEERDCCDCGTQRRTCSTSTCQWGAWSTCHGPDPQGGAEQCDTGEPGICAEGRLRCVEGCLACSRMRDPVPELCNDLDDDCNGLVDDGSPQVLGDPPPAFAARLLDFSVPRRLAPGEIASGWALFENVGSGSWPAGQVWLGAMSPSGGAPSLLWDASSWPAHDVLALIPDEVPPGAGVQVVFRLEAAQNLDRDVTETFALLRPSGHPMLCPSPIITVTVGPRQRTTSAEVDAPTGSEFESTVPPAASPPAPDEAWVSGGCGCHAGSPGAPLAPVFLLGCFFLGFILRHRKR